MHETSDTEPPLPPVLPAHPARAAARIRRLGAPERAAMEALFALAPGYSLFLSTNLSYLDSSTGLVRYWGAYRQGELNAVLMMVGRRAMLYTAPDAISTATLAALARVADEQPVDFIIGHPAGVDALLTSPRREQVQRREEHYLAECHPAGDRMPVVTLPPGTLIRRARPSDLEALTTLYYRTDGFESLSKDQVRRTMYGRVRSLRTWVAEYSGRLLSAASTSAETARAAMVGGVWTAPEARGRGLSTAVVAALSRELLGEQRRPYLFYLTGNTPAAHVYARVGYHTIGRWSIAYLTPETGKEDY